MRQHLKRIVRALIPRRYWMAKAWELRARSNALHYVADFRQNWDDDTESFFITGLHDTERFLNVANWTDTEELRLLEIGCGVGRMTRHLSERFKSVTALDISPTMIEKARQMNPGLTNVTFEVSNGVDLSGLANGSFDRVMSYIVFQHLPGTEIIERYVDEGLRVLAPDGQFCFHGRHDNAHPIPGTYGGASMDLDAIASIAANHSRNIRMITGTGTADCFVLIA